MYGLRTDFVRSPYEVRTKLVRRPYKSVQISTNQYESVRISTNQYKSVQISTNQCDMPVVCKCDVYVIDPCSM